MGNNIGQVPCLAWRTVLSDPKNDDLVQAFKDGTATPHQTALGFQKALGLSEKDTDLIEGVLKFADPTGAAQNRVRLEDGIFKTGPAIHPELDFGIARLASELEAKGVDKAEIAKSVGARFDEIYLHNSVMVNGERVIPVSASHIAKIVHSGIQLRLKEDPQANGSASEVNVIMAGEIAAYASMAYKHIGRGDAPDGSKTVSYDELKDWYITKRLPDTRLLSAVKEAGEGGSTSAVMKHMLLYFGDKDQARLSESLAAFEKNGLVKQDKGGWSLTKLGQDRLQLQAEGQADKAPNALLLGFKAGALEALPAAFIDLKRTTLESAIHGAKVFFGKEDAQGTPVSQLMTQGAMHSGGCPFAKMLVHPSVVEHPKVGAEG